MAEMMAAQAGVGGKRGKRRGSRSRNNKGAPKVDEITDAETPAAASTREVNETAPASKPAESNEDQEQFESEDEQMQEPERHEPDEDAHSDTEKPEDISDDGKEREQDEDEDIPANTPAALQSELEKILQKHDPSKVAQIPRMLASLRGGRVTFASLQKQLENKYGESLTRCSTSPFKSNKGGGEALSKPQLLSIQKQLKQVLFERMPEAKGTQLIKNILRQLQSGSLSFRALMRQFQKRYGETLTLSDTEDASGDSTKAKSRLSIDDLKSIHAQLKRVVKQKDPSKVSLIRPLMSRLQKGTLSFEQLQV